MLNERPLLTPQFGAVNGSNVSGSRRAAAESEKCQFTINFYRSKIELRGLKSAVQRFPVCPALNGIEVWLTHFLALAILSGDCPRYDAKVSSFLEGLLNMSLDTQCIDTMLSAWNSHDETILEQIVEKALSPDLEFCDPFHDICGHAPFIAMVKAFWAQHGHCKITRTSGIDAHHDRARYSWLIEAPNGGRFEGFDAVAIDLSAGKVRRVDGFFGPLSPA